MTQNIARLAEALSPLQPYIRGAPPGLPFQFDVDTIRRGLNFTLVTVAGDLDAMGEATGGGTYEALLSRSEARQLFGLDDLERIAELEAIAEERRKT